MCLGFLKMDPNPFGLLVWSMAISSDVHKIETGFSE